MRLRTFWKAAELDRALAAGADPLESGELLWRAQQLAEPKQRIALADSIERIVDEVDRGESESAFAPQRAKRDLVEGNRSLLLVLAERLRGDGPHDLRGLAAAALLVDYGDSPLHQAGSPFELKWQLLTVLRALDPSGPEPPGRDKNRVDVEVRHNPAESRYEVFADGALVGFAAYWLENGRVVFFHAEVDEAHRGQGLGNELIRSAVEDVRTQGKGIVPLCPFVAAYMDRHPSRSS